MGPFVSTRSSFFQNHGLPETTILNPRTAPRCSGICGTFKTNLQPFSFFGLGERLSLSVVLLCFYFLIVRPYWVAIASARVGLRWIPIMLFSACWQYSFALLPRVLPTWTKFLLGPRETWSSCQLHLDGCHLSVCTHGPLELWYVNDVYMCFQPAKSSRFPAFDE